MAFEPYKSVDSVINAWARRHNLTVGTEYKDYVVRTVLVPHLRKPFQLWIDPPEDGSIKVHSCDHAAPLHPSIGCSLFGPVQQLDYFLEEMTAWIGLQD